MTSDIVPNETARLVPSPDGSSITFIAPFDGSNELWRIAVGDGAVERLTTGRQAIEAFDEAIGRDGRARWIWLRSSATELGDLWVRDGDGEPRRRTELNAEVFDEIELREPVERWVEVDGRRIQGWYLPPWPANRERRGGSPPPLVTEIHGGPPHPVRLGAGA